MSKALDSCGPVELSSSVDDASDTGFRLQDHSWSNSRKRTACSCISIWNRIYRP